jgi:hypothetical protein
MERTAPQMMLFEFTAETQIQANLFSPIQDHLNDYKNYKKVSDIRPADGVKPR